MDHVEGVRQVAIGRPEEQERAGGVCQVAQRALCDALDAHRVVGERLTIRPARTPRGAVHESVLVLPRRVSDDRPVLARSHLAFAFQQAGPLAKRHLAADGTRRSIELCELPIKLIERA